MFLLGAFCAARVSEGAALQAILSEQIAQTEALVAQARAQVPGRAKAMRAPSFQIVPSRTIRLIYHRRTPVAAGTGIGGCGGQGRLHRRRTPAGRAFAATQDTAGRRWPRWGVVRISDRPEFNREVNTVLLRQGADI